MTKTKDLILTNFKIKNKFLLDNKNFKIHLTYKEHNEEFFERLFQLVFLFIILFCGCFFNIKPISQFLESSISNVKFFQPSPEQYFLLSLNISFYTAFFLESPILWIQLIYYFLPAFKVQKKFPVFFLAFVSIFLFFLGNIFSYYFLIPTALSFFLFYTVDVLEPLWSFQDYFKFILVLYLSSIYIFQIPIVQVIFGFLGFFSTKNYYQFLKYVILISTILGAVFTPSTDPLTQTVFSLAILVLYILGFILLFYFEKYRLIY
jgi:sec-independent protein translocase protein TatC